MKASPWHRRLIGCAACVVAVLLLWSVLFSRLDWMWFDFLQRHKASHHPAHTVIVAIDESTMQALGWPLSRDLYASAINAVSHAGARGIGVDIFFTDRTKSDEEVSAETLEKEQLLGNVAAHTKTVLASWVVTVPDTERAPLPATPNEAKIPHARPVSANRSFLHPLLSGIRKQHPIMAHVHLTVNRADGVARAIPPCIAVHDGYIPDLASRMTNHITLPPDCLIPQLIPLSGSYNDFPRISFADLLLTAQENPEKLRSVFENKYVLFAATDPTLRDIGATSAAEMEPLVSLHANRVEAILSGRNIVRVPTSATVLLSVLLFAVLLFFVRTSKVDIAVLFLSPPVLFSISFSLFYFFDIYLPAVAFTVPLFFALLATLLYDAWHYFLFTNMLSVAFGAYVSPDVLKWLKHTGADVLFPDHAERRPITVLFSDIAGYTSLSNSLSAQDVMRSLRFYLDKMIVIATSHGGYIDKINGDGLMILFGAPGYKKDHAQQAYSCAVEMQRAVRDMQDEWVNITGKPLAIRIGIATGTVFVGNLGSTTHIEYTAIGRDVNLAARLESASFVGGILLSEATLNELPQKPDGAWREVSLKGYDNAVKAWQIP